VKCVGRKIPERILGEVGAASECTVCFDVFHDQEALAVMISEAPGMMERLDREYEEEKRRSKEMEAKVSEFLKKRGQDVRLGAEELKGLISEIQKL
jgi:hypothetical protein